MTDESGQRFRLTDYANVAIKDGSTLQVNLYDPDVRPANFMTGQSSLIPRQHLNLVERALGQAKIPLSPLRISNSALQVKVSRCVTRQMNCLTHWSILICPGHSPDTALREKLAREAAGICEAARTAIRADRQKAQKSIKQSDIKSKNIIIAEGKQLDETTAMYTKTVDEIAKQAKSALLDN